MFEPVVAIGRVFTQIPVALLPKICFGFFLRPSWLIHETRMKSWTLLCFPSNPTYFVPCYLPPPSLTILSFLKHVSSPLLPSQCDKHLATQNPSTLEDATEATSKADLILFLALAGSNIALLYSRSFPLFV